MRTLQRRFVRVAAAAVAVGLAVGVLALVPATAHATLLSDLFAGDTITVDDKLFDSWQSEIDNGSKSVDPTMIDVTGLVDDPGTCVFDPGLKFTARSGALTVDQRNFIDFSFSFKVTVLDPDFKIVDASLALTDFVIDPDSDGIIEIVDFVFDPNLIGLGTLSVNADPFFGDLTDTTEFAEQSMVFQEISIFVDSRFDGATTGINMFEVRKSQQEIFTKCTTSGPDVDGDGEIDLAVEVGQLVTTEYDFTMTYSNPGGPPVLIVDTAPAEWIVTAIEADTTDLPVGPNAPASFANGFGTVDVFKTGKGAKSKSSTKIHWRPDPNGGTLNVLMETRQSPGKNNVKFAPTSCGPLFLNSGLAKVFEVDPATGEPLRDPVTLELLPPLFTAEPLVLAAVEDLDGGGVVPDGSGDEDGDGRTDIEEVRDFGSDPCVFTVF